MIKFELLNNDLTKLHQALLKDDLYIDMLTPDLDFDDIEVSNRLFLSVMNEDHESVGVFIVEPFTTACFSFHGGVYKKFRGKETIRFARECMQLIKESYKVSLISFTPESNKKAQNLLKKLGFIEKTTIKNGYSNDNLVLFAEQ